MNNKLDKLFSQENFDNYYLKIFEQKWNEFINQYKIYFNDLDNNINNRKNFLLNFHWYDFIYDFLYRTFNYSKISFLCEEIINELKTFDKTINFNNLSNLASSYIAFFDSHLVIESQIQCDSDTYQDYICEINNREDIVNLDYKLSLSKDIIKNKKIVFNWKTLCYSQNLEDLNFNFLAYGDKYINNRTDFDFENSNFNHTYFWSWNNDIDIRAVFTLYFQELYCKLNNFKAPAKYLMFKKINSFYTSEFENNINEIFKTIYQLISKFVCGEISTNLFIEKITLNLLEIIKQHYFSLSFITIIPVLYSELQDVLIKKIEMLTSNININKINNKFIINYLICNFLDIDTLNESYNQIINFYRCKTQKKNKYYLTTIVNYSYLINVVSRDRKKCKFIYNLNKKENVRLIYYSQVNKDISYSYNDYFFANNINESLKIELDNICSNLSNYVQTNKLIIREGFIVFEIKSENFNNLSQYIDQIYDAINNFF